MARQKSALAEQPAPEAESLRDAIRAMVEAGQVDEARQLIKEEQAKGDKARFMGNWPHLLEPPRGYITPGTSRNDVLENMAWYNVHRCEYPGEWVALRDGDLVDHDRSYRALLQRLRDAGVVEDVLCMETG